MKYLNILLQHYRSINYIYICIFIYLSILCLSTHFNPSPGVDLNLSQLSRGEDGVTLCTSRQFIVGPQRHKQNSIYVI